MTSDIFQNVWTFWAGGGVLGFCPTSDVLVIEFGIGSTSEAEGRGGDSKLTSKAEGRGGYPKLRRGEATRRRQPATRRRNEEEETRDEAKQRGGGSHSLSPSLSLHRTTAKGRGRGLGVGMGTPPPRCLASSYVPSSSLLRLVAGALRAVVCVDRVSQNRHSQNHHSSRVPHGNPARFSKCRLKNTREKHKKHVKHTKNTRGI